VAAAGEAPLNLAAGLERTMAVARIREADPRKGVIALPDGRQVPGFLPGQAGRRGKRPMDLFLAGQRGCPATEAIEEYQLRDDLARQVVGLTEVRLPLGFADVMTVAIQQASETCCGTGEMVPLSG